jgi:hypothetical protein
MAVFSIFAISGCSEKKADGNKNSAASEKKILWKDIEIGMSFDEVKKLYPAIELVSTADEEVKADIYKFDEGVVIQKEAFLVQFAFADNKIIEVYLSPKKEFYGPADKLFDGLEEELTQKYGNPIDQSSGRMNQFFYNYEQIVWNVQNVIIILHHEKASLSTDISTLYLSYQPGEIKKEDNL